MDDEEIEQRVRAKVADDTAGKAVRVQLEGAIGFWLSVGGFEHGMLLGVVAEAMAEAGRVEALQERLVSLEREEGIGPVLDPGTWTQPNAFARARLIRGVLRAAIALGEAERKRRADWNGRI